MRIPDINAAQGTRQISQVVSQPNILEPIASGMSDVAQLIQQKEERDTRSWLAKAKTDAKLGIAFRMKELTEQGVSNMSEALVKDIDGITQPILQTAPNDRAKEEWGNAGREMKADFLIKAIDTEITLKKGQSLQNYNQSQDNVIKARADGSISHKEGVDLLNGNGDILFGVDAVERSELTGKKLDQFLLSSANTALKEKNYEDYNSIVEQAKNSSSATAYTSILKAGKEQEIEQTIVDDLTKMTDPENPSQPQYLMGDNLTEKNLNTGYQALFAEDIQNGNALAQARFNKSIAVTGVIPSDFIKDVKSTFIKDDPYEKAAMFSMVDTLVSTNPAVADQLKLSAAQKTEIEMTNYYTAIGEDTNLIKQRVADMWSLPEDVVAERKARLKPQAGSSSPEIEPDMDIGALVSKDTVAGFVYNSVELPENTNDKRVMEAGYKKVFEREYTLTGDENYAQAAADKYFKVNHGISKVTGVEQVMAFPPEKVSGNPLYSKVNFGEDIDYSGNVEWQKKQLELELRQWERKGSKEELDLSRYKLSAEPMAAKKAAARQPINYYVSRKEDDGSWTALGMRLYFDPAAKDVLSKAIDLKKENIQSRDSKIKANDQFFRDAESGKTPQWQGM